MHLVLPKGLLALLRLETLCPSASLISMWEGHFYKKVLCLGLDLLSKKMPVYSSMQKGSGGLILVGWREAEMGEGEGRGSTEVTSCPCGATPVLGVLMPALASPVIYFHRSTNRVKADL